MTATPGDLTQTPQGFLDHLRIDGAIFLRGEYTEAWAYESPTGEMMAGLLRPGRERLLYFHIVASGRCWIEIEGGERHWADKGDVVVLPYGHQHKMGGVADSACIQVTDLIAPPPWSELPIVRHGTGGERTDIVCGYLDVDDPLFDPALNALPPVFVVRPTGTAATWLTSSVTYALESWDGQGGEPLILTQLPALLLAEVIRIHLESAPAVDRGWLAALRDAVLAPALAELHRAPDRKWTVADLAAAANVSRSVLDDRFRSVLGRSPIRYLTDWRLHVAKDLLSTTELGVAVVARRVGYDSEEAFSRAFKRAFGSSPAHWRAAQGSSA